MEILSYCPKCKNPLSAPEQQLLKERKELICRRCGTNLSIYFRSNAGKIEPATTNEHACLVCPFFQFGICTNKTAAIVVKESEIKFVGKNIKQLPKEGCNHGKD